MPISPQAALDVLTAYVDQADAKAQRLEELEHVIYDIRAALGVGWSTPDSRLADIIYDRALGAHNHGGTTHDHDHEEATAQAADAAHLGLAVPGDALGAGARPA